MTTDELHTTIIAIDEDPLAPDRRGLQRARLLAASLILAGEIASELGNDYARGALDHMFALVAKETEARA